jgi:hypothetical protein
MSMMTLQIWQISIRVFLDTVITVLLVILVTPPVKINFDNYEEHTISYGLFSSRFG